MQNVLRVKATNQKTHIRTHSQSLSFTERDGLM